MSLTEKQAVESLRKVVALYEWREWQLSELISSIIEACHWMRADRFDAVCHDMLTKCGAYKPKPREFIASYRSLEDGNGWKQADATSSKICSACSGQRFVTIRIVHNHSGEQRECLRPCPECGYAWQLSGEWHLSQA